MGEHRHPEITMHTHPLADYMVHIRAGDWKAVAALMLSSARKAAQAGADFAICPDNTIHQAFDHVKKDSPIPWLHIAESVAREAKGRGFQRLAILGTKYLMTGPVYPETLRRFGISSAVPDAGTRERMDDIIFSELVNAVFTETSRLFFNEVMAELKREGCDAAVLGCTEIPLIVRPEDAPLPTLDSTRLLARAALRTAIERDPA